MILLERIIAHPIRSQIEDTVHTNLTASARVVKFNSLSIHKKAVIQLQEIKAVIIGLSFVIVKGKPVTDIHSLKRLRLSKFRVDQYRGIRHDHDRIAVIGVERKFLVDLFLSLSYIEVEAALIDRLVRLYPF